MDAGEFEGLSYIMLSEEPSKNHWLDITYEKDDYTIYDYVSQYFGITIGEICTCLTCHAQDSSTKRILIYYVIRINITVIKHWDQLVMRKRLIWARSVWPKQIWWLNFMKNLS